MTAAKIAIASGTLKLVMGTPSLKGITAHGASINRNHAANKHTFSG
jgi:hypothetical protein